jgi:hypothetical protein
MRHEPADNRLIEVLRAESVSTHMQRLIARLDIERKQRKIAQTAVRHAVNRTHTSPAGCSACDHIEAILRIG